MMVETLIIKFPSIYGEGNISSPLDKTVTVAGTTAWERHMHIILRAEGGFFFFFKRCSSFNRFVERILGKFFNKL